MSTKCLSFRSRPRAESRGRSSSSSAATSEMKPSVVGVTLRERRMGTGSHAAEVRVGCRGGTLQNVTNKRNATYLTPEEYDEDLAQLDVLLHYVNNLSASLEFLQWEKKRISTDLVPTLLNMYDALYAKFTESSSGTSYQDALQEEEKPKETSEKGDKGVKESHREGEGCESAQEESRFLFEGKKRDLFILEPESHDGRGGRCLACNRGVAGRSRCLCSSEGSKSECPSSVVEDPAAENDYDIPEAIERGDTDSLRSSGSKSSLGLSFLKTSASPSSSFRMCKDRSRFRSLRTDSASATTSPAGTLSSSGSRTLPYRPVSVISSSSASSSSSSSSNSLPRGPPPGGQGSYLASAESLDDNEALVLLHSDSESSSRRRDRSLKARREKALRTGSDDSGVQCHIISLPSPPPLKPRYCDPNLDYMDRVVLEIVETEELYVRDLKEVIEGYLEYWRMNPEQGISTYTIETLFSNIEQIYSFNRRFLSELERCCSDPVAVAKCFVRNNSGFAIYTEYCTNYPRTVSLLTNLMREESSVRACRERQLALCHTLPLGSYLLKPVQRVLKYHLLLGNIVKNFGKDRPGHVHIWNALSAMTGIAHHINDMKRRHEHAVRVQEIQSLLYGWQGEDLTTFGELAAEGNFKMFGFKGVRHVFLFDKMLLIAKRRDENYLVYKAHIMCSDLMLIESIPGEPLSFHVIPFDNPKCQYTLECRNLDQKREWTLQLKRVILENYSANIPAHARQLVMELGQAKNNDLSGNDWKGGGGRSKSHHAPEYLERRKDKRRASEGGLNARLRIRRSSRTRKAKDEKESRSRSVSRTRETDEEEERKTSTSTAASPAEKTRLRLPLWRRRSEPGMKGGLRISSPQNTRQPSPTEDASPEKKLEDLSEKEREDKNEPEQSTAPPSESECDALLDRLGVSENNDSVDGENLEHIVSQLLQHQLQMQQIILNKQRRGIIRKKKLGSQYETSDTENEDTAFESPRPPLPASPPPPLTTSSHSPLPFPPDYRSFTSSPTSSFRRNEIPNSHNNNNNNNRNTEVKISNYDNLIDVWGGKTPKLSQKDTLTKLSFDVLEETKEKAGIAKLSSLRRVHSFSSSSILSKDDQTSSGSRISDKDSVHDGENNSNLVDEGMKERPATIAVGDTSASSNRSDLVIEGETGSKDNTPPVIGGKQSHFSFDNLTNIHPEHKIYSKASVNKGSIRKVLSKLTGPKASPHKTVSEPSTSLSNIYANSEFDPSHRKTGLVSCMARQCSRTLKERIKQIRTEEWDSPIKSPPPPPDSKLSLGHATHKQGSSSIGARLASAHEPSDYAVPVIHTPDQLGKSELRPDSVLSSSSSNSSGRESEARVVPEVSNDSVGDSFYEKSFEAIEAFLDDEMFRDSAIYSDQEDGQETSLSKDVALSPKHSFSYKYRSSFRGDGRLKAAFNSSIRKKSGHSTSKQGDDPLVSDESDLPTPTPEMDVNFLHEFSEAVNQQKKVPPPVPAKPDSTSVKKFRSRGTLIQQQLKNIEDRLKYPSADCSLESEAKAISTSSVVEQNDAQNQSPLVKNAEVMPKGWVKHVVGKLQQ